MESIDIILNAKEVCRIVGLARNIIWRYEKLGLFPKRRKLGLSRVGWLHSEVQDWVKQRPVAE